MNRLDRLTAILIHLQTKRVVRAQELADRFGTSLRTIYRDIRSLEEAGVPVGAEAGVGYFLTDYHLPPVMFTNAEASSLLLAAKLIEKWTDESVQTQFDSALFKIKSVLKRPDQEHLDDLSPNVSIAKTIARPPYADGLLSTIQQAIARHHVLDLQYHSLYNDTETNREVEPVGLYHYSLTWHLIAFCRKRQDYRDFRLDRIRSLTDTGQRFARHERLSLQEYLARERSCPDMPLINVTLVIQKTIAHYFREAPFPGSFVSEEDLGTGVRVQLNTPYLEGLARWLLTYGTTITIEQPDPLLALMQTLSEELRDHYASVFSQDTVL
ncbi:helix-turn-helix transcriptional regulator [Spirosoma agri]|uniref:YafY family transcriptional regulator n=1 Tax=Spirosoma agri TaxID=1987381 RepID=A0A6M0II02_9BACT|nr:YafY family protein [Spirosoma agri]NEU67315.1 YafY family transcriptional regulator [Spirosoma agri]